MVCGTFLIQWQKQAFDTFSKLISKKVNHELINLTPLHVKCVIFYAKSNFICSVILLNTLQFQPGFVQVITSGNPTSSK